MAGSTVRSATIELLRATGMTTIFGNPGSTELPMFRDFPNDFRYILGLQESVVMAMADGFAQATRNATLVNLHSAAGVGHSLGNLFTAFKNRTPLVVTAGQQARSILPYEAFLSATDATTLPQPYVKWSCEPARAEDVPAAIARAYDVAMQQPCGPTFVSIPVDDWERECDWPALPELTLCTPPSAIGIERLCALLDGAERPALVLGTGVANSGGWDAAIRLAERTGCAVWSAPYAAREIFPEDHPQFAGFLPAWRDRIQTLLAPYDAILVAGAPVFTYHVEGSGPHWPPHAKLMALSIVGLQLGALPGGV